MCAPRADTRVHPYITMFRYSYYPVNKLFDEAALVFYYRGNTGKEVIVNI